jgi:hypothetical protein
MIVQPGEQHEGLAGDDLGRASVEVAAACARAVLRGFQVLRRCLQWEGYFAAFAAFTHTLTDPAGTEQTPSPRPLISFNFFSD